MLVLAFVVASCVQAATHVSPVRISGKDPARAQEQNQRGIEYYNARAADKAIAAFSAVILADPDSFMGHLNLAFVLVAQQRYPEAEPIARRAVELRKLDARARYLLGVALASQRKNLSEAEAHLQAASTDVVEARLELSRMFIERGDFTRAMQELELFSEQTKQNGRLQLLAK